MLVTAVVPTRSRPDALAQTLVRLGKTGAAVDGEVVVIDNASDPPAEAPQVLENGWPVRTHRLEHNAGVSARNLAASEARGEWLLMLDDDSAPVGDAWLSTICGATDGVSAIGAAVVLPGGGHEAGGLPEVFVGCGALVRRETFHAAGGYDEEFGYYGEETDLCARLIAQGGRVIYDSAFRVLHERSDSGRDVARIMELLARNETLTIHRYAPESERERWIERTLQRRRLVAEREGVTDAFERGVRAFEERRETETPAPLAMEQWRRLTGSSYTSSVLNALCEAPCAVVPPHGAPGKHEEVIREELAARGLLVDERRDAEVLVAGTLAPGRAIDAARALRSTHPHKRVLALSPLA